MPQDVARLPQHLARARDLAEPHVHVCELDQRLRRHDGQRVREQRPEPGRARRVLARAVDVAPMDFDACGDRVHERARPVVVERGPLAPSRARGPTAPRRLPVAPIHRDDAPLGEDHRRERNRAGPASPRRRPRRGSDPRGRVRPPATRRSPRCAASSDGTGWRGSGRPSATRASRAIASTPSRPRQRAQVRDVALHRAAVRQHLRAHRSIGGDRPAFGVDRHGRATRRSARRAPRPPDSGRPVARPRPIPSNAAPCRCDRSPTSVARASG